MFEWLKCGYHPLTRSAGLPKRLRSPAPNDLFRFPNATFVSPRSAAERGESGLSGEGRQRLPPVGHGALQRRRNTGDKAPFAPFVSKLWIYPSIPSISGMCPWAQERNKLGQSKLAHSLQLRTGYCCFCRVLFFRTSPSRNGTPLPRPPWKNTSLVQVWAAQA